MSYTILLVDDVKVNRVIMENVIKKKMGNYRFEHAKNGREALEFVLKQSIDLIVLDLMMPEVDGFKVLKILKQNPITRDIPVIVYTAAHDLVSIEKTLELGALDFFFKPLTQTEIQIIVPLKVQNALKYYEQQKKITKDIEVARALQGAMVKIEDDLSPYVVDYLYYPSAGVSGDMFDFVKADAGTLWVIIADVMGHGVASAMLSTMVKVMFRYAVERHKQPDAVLSEMNRFFCHLFDKDNAMNFTAFVCKIDETTLSYSSAGHPYPLVLKADGSCKSLALSGFMAGLFDDATYELRTEPFERGDRLFCYTDGLYDAGYDTTKVRILSDDMRHIVKTLPWDDLSADMWLDRLLKFFKVDQIDDISDDIAVFIVARDDA